MSIGLVGIGRKGGDGSLVSSLSECHARIRSFSSLAAQLCDAGVADAERADAAAKVHRYFTQALPLHVADEEKSIEPRLRALGRSDVDAALALMEAQHDEHDQLLARLIPRWAELAALPDAALAAATRADAEALARALEDHLTAEEQTILPAVAALPVEQQQAIAGEMRARRD